MGKYAPDRVIEIVTEALTGSVPRKEYDAVIGALSRCSELLSAASVSGNMAQTRKECAIYANVIRDMLEGLNPPETHFFDMSDFYGTIKQGKRRPPIVQLANKRKASRK